jgi:hypothetical protein
MPTTGTSMENGATTLDGWRLISEVQMPEPTSVATSTVKRRPATASTPSLLPSVLTDVATRVGPSSARETASIGTGGTAVIHSMSRNGWVLRACRLQTLPTAQPRPPHSVSRTGTSVAPPPRPAR